MARSPALEQAQATWNQKISRWPTGSGGVTGRQFNFTSPTEHVFLSSIELPKQPSSPLPFNCSAASSLPTSDRGFIQTTSHTSPFSCKRPPTF
ncbi:hypothetical protein CGCF415_v005811 [Colletotrichum fructicola]|nr:hypothetical protein CGCF415_v005811 [Colletotrichum fructicola]KAF4922297.1 hypothetical protein CGCF245_v015383 [Colletotrichum fructicola]KAF5487877.1 hypothetical protein CGCF413_v012137 [Colletotrichum fructicola]